jgi:hypothetical protein
VVHSKKPLGIAQADLRHQDHMVGILLVNQHPVEAVDSPFTVAMEIRIQRVVLQKVLRLRQDLQLICVLLDPEQALSMTVDQAGNGFVRHLEQNQQFVQLIK